MSILELVRHVLREALDRDLAEVVLDHAALLDAGGLARLDHGHVHGDRLGSAHGEEVDVDQRVVDVVALDLARQHQVLGAVDHEVDEGVGTGGAVEDVEHLPRVDGEGHGLDALAVEHARDAAVGSEPPGDALAGLVALLCLQFRFHGEQILEVRGSAGDCTETAPGTTAMEPGPRASSL